MTARRMSETHLVETWQDLSGTISLQDGKSAALHCDSVPRACH